MDDPDSASASGESTPAGFVSVCTRVYPGPLPLALLGSIVALLVTTSELRVTTQLQVFVTGVFGLFALQMSLVLYWLLSVAVVESPAVGQLFERLGATLPTTQRRIIVATSFVALTFGWLNWALGLFGGIFVGQKLCRRADSAGVAVHYPLVLMGGLCSLVVTNQGVSSPGALILADGSGRLNYLVDSVGSLPLSTFLQNPVNVGSTAVLVLTLPFVLALLAPEDERSITPLGEANTIVTGSVTDTLAPDAPSVETETVADRLEQSPVVSVTTALLGAVAVGGHLATGGAVTMFWLLFVLLMLGVLVQYRPIAYVSATESATRWVTHLVIPFILYAGIFSLLTESGGYDYLSAVVADSGMPHVTSYGLALLLGLLVPDPGSQWLLQGATIPASASVPTALVAIMYGAGVSNLWVGFVFLRLFSIPGFDWRQFGTYALVVTTYVSAVLLVALRLA